MIKSQNKVFNKLGWSLKDMESTTKTMERIFTEDKDIRKKYMLKQFLKEKDQQFFFLKKIKKKIMNLKYSLKILYFFVFINFLVQILLGFQIKNRELQPINF